MKYKTPSIIPLLYKTLREEASALYKNAVSEWQDVKRVSDSLTSVSDGIQLNQISQESGLDSELRPAYVIMQGVVETALANALNLGVCNEVKAHIVAPRMPTPLMLSEGKSISEINLADPLAFAQYRRNTLLKFLEAGGKLCATYSYDAHAALEYTDAKGLENYMRCVQQYNNIQDCPNVKIEMGSFPQQYTGAMYYVDGALSITVQSMQVTQIDQNPQIWAIKMGDAATERAKEMDEFLREYSSPGM